MLPKPGRLKSRRPTGTELQIMVEDQVVSCSPTALMKSSRVTLDIRFLAGMVCGGIRSTGLLQLNTEYLIE